MGPVGPYGPKDRRGTLGGWDETGKMVDGAVFLGAPWREGAMGQAIRPRDRSAISGLKGDDRLVPQVPKDVPEAFGRHVAKPGLHPLS